MSVSEDTQSAPKSASIVALIGVVAVLTLVAAGGGWLLGGQLGLGLAEAAKTEGAKQATAAEVPTGSVVPLKPILTNIKIPQDVWIRLEAGVVARPGEKVSDELAATLAGDFTAFMRTVNLMQLRGPAGIEYLRTDLQERAAIRSEGKIEKVYIWALVME
ncbi:flagellar basal body-associated FliL family protein [Phyllobacterium bourgognense]|uniref:Flagellar protein FliL n=1 Tax=Phyllobacterium bourgognense TaxID=314236 RepID=A0A368YTI9_9HYPH|nr:flagellar basal body-associated FliL family protein [Phyllobacterium bourgognense]RCW82267.1 flagellar FliL protein [Phyllobacterium bourgognense]